MTVPVTANSFRYPGDGTTGPWEYPVEYTSEDYIEVWLRDPTDGDTLLTPTTNYVRISGGPGKDAGGPGEGGVGSVYQTTVAVAVGQTIAILANTPAAQTVPADRINSFRSQEFEQAFDNLAIQNRAVDDNVARAWTGSPLDPPGQKTVRNLVPGFALTVFDDSTLIGNEVSVGSIGDAADNADRAEAALEEFERQYLGAYSSDPTMDNEGNPLQIGALYTNTSAPGSYDMRQFTDTGWRTAYTNLANPTGVQTLNGGPLAGTRNKIINGDFDIWQRSVGPIAVGGYTGPDRFTLNGGTHTVTVERQTTPVADLTALKNAKYFCRATVTVLSAGTIGVLIGQRIERVLTLQNRVATLTYYARSSEGTEQLTPNYLQNFGTGGSPSSDVSAVFERGDTLTTSWTKYTKKVTLPSISGKTLGTNGNDYLEVSFSLGNPVLGTIDIAHISLVEGDATAEDDPFSPRLPGEEERLCKRYYQQIFTGLSWSSQSATAIVGFGDFPVKMRTAPSASALDNTPAFYDIAAAATRTGAATTVISSTVSAEGASTIVLGGFTGCIVGNVTRSNNAGNPIIGLDAEL